MCLMKPHLLTELEEPRKKVPLETQPSVQILCAVRRMGWGNSVRKVCVHMLGKAIPNYMRSPQQLWDCTYPGPPTPHPYQGSNRETGTDVQWQIFLFIFKNKINLPSSNPPNKQKIRLNKIYSEYTQQTSVCAIKYCLLLRTNLKQTIYKCSGRWGEAQVLTLWGLGRQDGGSERKGKSILLFLILSI